MGGTFAGAAHFFASAWIAGCRVGQVLGDLGPTYRPREDTNAAVHKCGR